MREQRKIWRVSRCSSYDCPYSSALPLVKAPGRWRIRTISSIALMMRYGILRPLKFFSLEELVVDLADDDSLNLFLVHVNDNILDFADKHALVRIDLKPEQLGNLGFHRYQMKVYT